ncbi:MAG: transposase [Dethiobacteria bacterium]
MKKRALQFLKYINKVFGLNQFLNNLSDGRKNPSISLSNVIAILFLGIVTWKGSLNQIEEKMRQGYFDKALKQKIKKGSAETFGNVLEASDVEQYIEYCREVVKISRYNKAFQGGTLDGFTVAALDGTELTRTESKHRSCNCCKKSEYTKEDGTKVIQMHENFVGVSYVGKPPNLILGIERIAPGEGETTAALRLLENLKSWHYYYADVVTLDSLYACAPVINKLLEQNVIGVIRVKQEYYTLIRDAEGLFSSREPDLIKKGVSIKSDWYENDKAGRKYKYDLKIWDEEGFTTWENVKKPLRALKVEETRVDHRGNPLSEPQITYIIVTADKNVISAESVWRILHRRWDIENKTFHDLKKYWSFGHDFHHEENAFLVMRWLIVIAANLFMLFLFRRLCGYVQKYTQKGLADWLACTLCYVEVSIWDTS